MNDEQIPLIEGDDEEPETLICPALDEMVADDDAVSPPQGIPPESFEADPEDAKGLGGLCGDH